MKYYPNILFVILIISCLFLSCKNSPEQAADIVSASQELSSHTTSADTTVFLEGLALLQQKDYDKARERLIQSSKSDNIHIKAESFLYLNALEMQLEHYADALLYLEKYHNEAFKLYRMAVDAQETMDSYKVEIDRSMERLHKRHNRLILGIVATIVLAAAIIATLVIRNKHKGIAKVGGQGHERHGGIGPAHPLPEPSVYKRHLISAEIFKQTPIYGEILELAAQSKSRYTKVLNTSRQQVLDAKLGEVFGEFAAGLETAYPLLTDNYIKLCCLSLLPLSTFAKALCFGSTETNIVKQRKHQIKKKMGCHDGSPALFEFIFAPRQDNSVSALNSAVQ